MTTRIIIADDHTLVREALSSFLQQQEDMEVVGQAADGSGGRATVSASLYLLVKHMGCQPRLFVCPADAGTAEFRLSDWPNVRTGFTLADAWDFGPESYRCCSYSYHLPYSGHALTISRDPGMAVAADRNPWMKGPTGEPKSFIRFDPDLKPWNGSSRQARHGNSASHRDDGQNVLFLDGHVAFEQRAYCGLDNDNIYLVARDPERGSALGLPPALGVQPANRRDSVLVNDPPTRMTVTHQARNVDSHHLRQTVVVATLDCPVPEHKNALWCSTFQMAWDKFRTDLIHEPIQIREAGELAGRLNRGAFPADSIEERSYYVNAGFVRDGVLQQIQKDMARRFPSEPALTFDRRYQMPKAAVAYAYLNVGVDFPYPYYTHATAFEFRDSGGVRTPVSAFCAQTIVRASDYEHVRDQVEVLYYEGDHTSTTTEHFAIDLSKQTQPYQVVLARMPRCNTLGEGARALQENAKKFRDDPDYDILRKLRPIDTLIVPDVLFKLTHHFEELLGKSLSNERWQDHFLFEALQKIDFALSRTGVTLRSEAIMGSASGRRVLNEPRHLHFDRPFLICVRKREAGATPFFLMWVDNAELMQAATRDR